jgi:hypothetical protein
MTNEPSVAPPPRFDLGGQVALVTGAAQGIGRACAIALAQYGADVALGLRDARTGGSVIEIIRGLGRAALPLQMDVTRPLETREDDAGLTPVAPERAVAYGPLTPIGRAALPRDVELTRVPDAERSTYAGPGWKRHTKV